MDATCTIQDSIHVFSLVHKYVSRILGTYQNAKEGQSLFTSIPYCDGWTVKVNGQKVQPDKVVDSLYSISLVEGENVVEMKFHVKYAGAGIACSIIGIAMLVFAEFYRKRRK